MLFNFPHHFATSPINIETAGVANDPRIVTGSPAVRVVDFASLYEGASSILAFVGGVGESAQTVRNFGMPIKADDLNASAVIFNNANAPIFGASASYALGNRIQDTLALSLGADVNSPINSVWTVAGGLYGNGGNLNGPDVGVRRVLDLCPTAMMRHPIAGDDIDTAWQVLRRRAVVVHSGNPSISFTLTHQSNYLVYTDTNGTEEAGTINAGWSFTYNGVPNLKDNPIGAAAIGYMLAVIRNNNGNVVKQLPFVLHVPLTTKTTGANSVTFKSTKSMTASNILSIVKNGCQSAGYPIGSNYYVHIARHNTDSYSYHWVPQLIVLDLHKSVWNRLAWS